MKRSSNFYLFTAILLSSCVASNNVQVRDADTQALASILDVPDAIEAELLPEQALLVNAPLNNDCLFTLSMPAMSKGLSESPTTQEIRNQATLEREAIEVHYQSKALLQGYGVKNQGKASQVQDTVKKKQDEAINQDQNTYEGMEVDGLIIDETRTKVGRDFYDYFYSNWNAASTVSESYTLLITERVIRGSLSQITVNLNEVVVFEQYVQPRTEDVESLAGEAIRNARFQLENMQEMNDRLNEERDMYGSGIY